MTKYILTATIVGLLLITSTVYAEEFKINFDKCHYVKLGEELKTKKAEPFSVECSKDKSVKCMVPKYGEIEYPIVFENNSSMTFAYQDIKGGEVIYLNKKTKKVWSQWTLATPNYIGNVTCSGTVIEFSL